MFGWFKKNDYLSDDMKKIIEEHNRLAQSEYVLKKQVEELKAKNSKLMVRNLTKDFRTALNGVGQGGAFHIVGFKSFVDKKENLLEIKLKDTDSVPEVWYEGRRLDGLPNGLVSIDYNWKTKGHDDCFEGENILDVEWLGVHKEGFRR